MKSSGWAFIPYGTDSTSTRHENLKRMIRYMRSNNYEKAYEILRNDHFLIGKSSALKK